MRDTFPGYYHPTDDEFSELWANCIFVLDANVLLSLYELSPETAQKLEQFLTEFSDRDQLWVPHQAALEYQRHRRGVIEAQATTCDAVGKRLEKTQRELGEVRQHRRPPYLEEIDPLLETIQTTFKQITEKLAEWKQGRVSLLDADHIRDRVDELLEGRLGSEYPEERLEEIYREAQIRYRRNRPPGFKAFKDVDPNGNQEDLRKYGDVILWFQVIDHAKETEKSIIFLTNEGGEDWWLRSHGGQTIGPRPELIHEMRSKAGVSFYMYRIQRFIEHAGRHFGQEVSQEVIEETRDLERQSDKQTETLQAMQLLLKDPYFGLRPHEEIVSRLVDENTARIEAIGLAFTDSIRTAAGLHRYDELLKRQIDEQNARRRALAQALAGQPELRYREMLDAIQRQTRAYGIPREDTAGAADGEEEFSPNSGAEEPPKDEPDRPDTESNNEGA